MPTESMEGKTALELLAMGSKAYWLKNYTDATAYLSRSSEMLVEEHKDDKHNSLGNVYLYYGKTLLELAREDGDPLGDAVPKEVEVEDDVSDEEGSDDDVPRDDEDDDGEEGEAEEGEKEETESEQADENKEGGKVDEKQGDKAEEKKETKTEKAEDNKTDDAKAANISINGEAASSTTETDDADDSKMEEDEEVIADGGEGGSADKPEEEEPTDLQLAWEVLELGKIIFERRGESGREDFADCLVTLGEVSLESENFDSAIADITAGLEIQKEIYKETKDLRKLAETHYKLGMALSAHNKIEEGITHYTKTLDLLKQLLVILEAKPNPGCSDVEEIKDIKNLIPELEDKVTDLKTYKDEANNPIEEEPPIVSSPEKKANNISHLVKRKRKLEDVAEEAAANAAKKAPK